MTHEQVEGKRVDSRAGKYRLSDSRAGCDDSHDTNIQISFFLLIFFHESKNAVRFFIRPLVAEIASESSNCLESSTPAYI